MEAKPEEEVKEKHEKLKEGGGVETQQEIVIPDNKHIKNTASPFLSKSKAWSDEEHFSIPADILANIENNLNFKTPSNI